MFDHNTTLRALITSIVVPYIAYNTKNKFLALTISTFVLDSLDCKIYKLFTKYNCSTIRYQKEDKIIDLFTYALVIGILWKNLNNLMKVSLLTSLVYRSVGVYKFYKNGDIKTLHRFPDFMNGIMVAYLLSTPNTLGLLILMSLVIKTIFERVHHKANLLPSPN